MADWRRITVLLAVCVPVLQVLAAGPAAAHLGGGSPASYVSAVTSVEPAVPGLHASTASGGYIVITNQTDMTVIVLGYEGEAYLRITAHGVWKNTRSTTAYLNADIVRNIPADAKASPHWEQVSPASTYQFHDLRTHWMGSGQPAAVKADPGKRHLISNWTIPLLVDGEPVTINGTLTWVPAGFPTWAVVFGVTCGLLLFGFVFAIILDSRRSRAQHDDTDLGAPADQARPGAFQ